MAKINLLPWREQRREQQRKEFLAVLGGVAAAGVTEVLAGHLPGLDRQRAQEIVGLLAREAHQHGVATVPGTDFGAAAAARMKIAANRAAKSVLPAAYDLRTLGRVTAARASSCSSPTSTPSTTARPRREGRGACPSSRRRTWPRRSPWERAPRRATSSIS